MIDPNLPRVSYNEFDANFDHYLDRIENGETFVLTDNGEDRLLAMPAGDYDRMVAACSATAGATQD